MRLFWAALLLLALAWPAEARLHAGPNAVQGSHHRLRNPAALDTGVGAPAAAAYSFRRLRSAYAGPAVQLRRASDSTLADIGFSGSGDFDTAAATAHCNATSCFLAKWYDQSGNARDAVQATVANQPALTFNCQGTLPCARIVGVKQLAFAGPLTPVAPLSLNAVAIPRVIGSVGMQYVDLGNNQLLQHIDNNFYLFNTILAAGISFGAPALGAWHSHTGVMAGAAGVVRVDATEVTGTATADLAAGGLYVLGGTGSSFDIGEWILWIGYALTATERAALTANQRAYWGF